MHKDRPNLVLLHGWGMNNAVWDALPPTLTDRFHLHPIELPGHGHAHFETHWRDLPDWADAVLAQAPDQAIWLGWSLGALVALQAALQTRVPGRPLGPGQHASTEDKSGYRRAAGDGPPWNRDPLGSRGSASSHDPTPSSSSPAIGSQAAICGRARTGASASSPSHAGGGQATSHTQASTRISALILVTANPRFVQAADWRAAMPTEVFDGFHASLLDDPEATLGRFLSLQVRGGEDARETLRRVRAGIAKPPQPRPEALLAGLDLLREEDLRCRLADIPQPALWLFGKRDTLVPAAVAERVALLMPNARCQTIAGAAHAPLLSHGDQAAEAISEFLYGSPA